MPYIEHGTGEYVTAHAQINHGDLAADGGFVGVAIKQVTPPADQARTSRNVIASGEAYFLRTHGKVETAFVTSSTQGALAYIDTTTNAVGLASGAGKQVLGRISTLAGQHGTPTGRMRIDLDEKV